MENCRIDTKKTQKLEQRANNKVQASCQRGPTLWPLEVSRPETEEQDNEKDE